MSVNLVSKYDVIFIILKLNILKKSYFLLAEEEVHRKEEDVQQGSVNWVGVVCALVLVALIGSVLMAVAIAQKRRMAAMETEDAKSVKNDDVIINFYKLY